MEQWDSDSLSVIEKPCPGCGKKIFDFVCHSCLESFLESTRTLEAKPKPKYETVRRRRLKKGGHSDKEWRLLLEEHRYKCAACGTHWNDAISVFGNIGLTKDHIIPLSKGGNNNIDNIQPLCWSCNNKKGAT